MLGEMVLKAQGKVTGIKRLPEGKLEHTVALRGKLLGEDFSTTLSTVGGYRPDGSTFAVFQGSVTKGGVTLRYEGMGNAKRYEGGLANYRGVICFSSSSGNFSRLSGIAVLWEAELDDGGAIRGKGWEWK